MQIEDPYDWQEHAVFADYLDDRRESVRAKQHREIASWLNGARYFKHRNRFYCERGIGELLYVVIPGVGRINSVYVYETGILMVKNSGQNLDTCLSFCKEGVWQEVERKDLRRLQQPIYMEDLRT